MNFFLFPLGRCCITGLLDLGRGWFLAAPIIAEADTLPWGLLGHIYWKENQEDTRAALPQVFSMEY